MKAKKLHIDECYVCIISFIRSVMALALALVLMVLALLTSLQESWPLIYKKGVRNR